MPFALTKIKQVLSRMDWEHVTPLPRDVLNGFAMPVNSVRVVILGQDPYPQPGVANGVAFAVNPHCVVPQSLKNIFAEVHATYGKVVTDRTLKHWQQQGVLLVNKNLTTRVGEPQAHDKLWQTIVLETLQDLAFQNSKIVWVLWGKVAQQMEFYLPKNAIIIKDFHPSPLSFRLRHHQTFKMIERYHKIEW